MPLEPAPYVSSPPQPWCRISHLVWLLVWRQWLPETCDSDDFPTSGVIATSVYLRLLYHLWRVGGASLWAVIMELFHFVHRRWLLACRPGPCLLEDYRLIDGTIGVGKAILVTHVVSLPLREKVIRFIRRRDRWFADFTSVRGLSTLVVRERLALIYSHAPY